MSLSNLPLNKAVPVLLIIVGIQFFSIGILYDLLMKTYFESQDKKPYRIRKVFKFDA